MTASGPAWILAGATLMIASVFDLRSRRIPNWLTGGAAVGGLAIAYSQGALFGAVPAALLAMLVMGSPNFVRSQAVGAGDVKLAGAMGAMLGAASALLVIGFAACEALACLVVMKSLQESWNGSSTFPFAPFLMVGFLLAACAGFLGG